MIAGDTPFDPPAKPPTRLSVSAMRDYHRCGHYFKLGRIEKVAEDKVTHHRWAGSVVHAAFMLAYGTPIDDGARRTNWNVDNAGTIEDALELFDMIWEGRRDTTDEELLVGPSRAQAAFDVLSDDAQLKPVAASNFAKGQLKALKNDNVQERKEAYRTYFREMLEASLVEGLAYPVIALEHEVKYALGGVEMLGYIDLVLRKPNGGLVFVDLKTGSKAPMDRELACEDQMQAYYETAYEDRKPDEVWYSHMKSGTILPVPRSEHFIAALHETAPLVMAAIEQGVFPKRLGTDCATCSRKKSCLG